MTRRSVLPVLTFKAGEYFRAVVRFRDEDGASSDLTGCTAASALRWSLDPTGPRHALTATVLPLAGEIELTCDDGRTAAWPAGLYDWDLVLTDPAGRPDAIPDGGNFQVRVSRSATLADN